MQLLRPHRGAVLAAVVVAGLVAPAIGRAQTFSWAQGNSGGNWSATTNWNPAGNPTTGNTATLGDVTTGTRKVVYNTGANSGTLGTLLVTQTSAAVNELEVQRTLSITNAVSLGAAAGGTSRLVLDPAAGGASFTTTFSGGLTINAGGELRLRSVNTTGATNVNANVSGNITVAGGSLVLAPLLKLGGSTGASQSDISGTLTMSSGTILLDNVDASGESDRRLRVSGNVSITGGDIVANVPTANLMLTGGSLTFSPTTFEAAKIMIQLDGANQTFAAGVAVNDITLRGSGSWTKTISSTASGPNIGLIQIADGSATAAGGTFKLGSDLTLHSGRGMPAAAGVGQSPEGGRIDLGVDADVYTLNLTSNAGRWAPNFAGGATSAVWTVSGNGGRIIANGYDFAGASITANVGAGLTLESKAGNGVVNNLGGGTVNASSTFLYSGAAAAATPSTLTATATIGNVAVSSGALRLGSLGGIAGAATVSGGSLDLGNTTRTFTNVTLTGGQITAGTLATTGAYSLQAGTISAIVSGSQGVTKTTAGTVTLSGTNTFTGVAAVNAGTLLLGDSSGLGGDTGAGTQKLSMAGGTLNLAGFSPTVFGVGGTAGTITSASGGTLTIKVNNGATGATLAGNLNLATAAASGRSYQVLTAANTFTGTTSIAASTLLAIENVAGLGASGAGQGTSVAGTLELKGQAATAFSVAEPLSISAGTLRTNAQSGIAGTTTLSGPIDLASGTATFEVNTNAPLLRLTGAVGGSGSVAKTAAGTLEIASTSNYAGSTTISAGSLVVNGALTGTSGVAVGTGTRLAGSGTIAAALSGAGLVSPGNSPGILTATQVNPTGGLDHAFEFTAIGSPDYAAPTASINDILRLTDATTPFATSLSAGNVIDVYFDVATLTAGDTFRGGFFTDAAGDFSAAVAGATYAYWVRGDGSGTARTFDGKAYFSLTGFNPTLSVTRSTVAETAAFAGGTVNGQVTQFVVVPEPGTVVLGGIAAAALLLAGIRRHAARTRGRN